MIRIVRPAVATSIQDLGRFGRRAEGLSRSGAMDSVSLRLANRAAGALEGSAAIEFGPGPLTFEVLADGVIAFGGAPRRGAVWWESVEVARGDRFELSSPIEGVWSYLSIAGGVEAPVVAGSRSTQVREGIGKWLEPGDTIDAGREVADPRAVDPPPLQGPVRIFGELPGKWSVGGRIDRMGYQLEGERLLPGAADEWSEPVLPGCIQVDPAGVPTILMAEDPVAGGYEVRAVVHSDDLRLVAQTTAGMALILIPESGAAEEYQGLGDEKDAPAAD